MRRFIFASQLWDHRISVEEHVFCVQGYLSREPDRCARVDIEYAPEITDKGSPRFIQANITVAARNAGNLQVSVGLQQAQRLTRLAEAKVMFDRFRVAAVGNVILYRYHLQNRGISILHVSEEFQSELLRHVAAVELNAYRLDNLDLAYTPLTSWTQARRHRYLGRSA